MNKKSILLLTVVLLVTLLAIYALVVQGNFSLFSRASLLKEGSHNAEIINQDSLPLRTLETGELAECVSSFSYLQDATGDNATCYAVFNCSINNIKIDAEHPVQCKDSKCESLPNAILSCRPLNEWIKISREVCGC